MGVISIFPCCFISVGGLLGAAALALWIWMIVEVVTKEPPEEPNKLMWVLIVVLLGWLGALIYLIARRPERIRTYGR